MVKAYFFSEIIRPYIIMHTIYVRTSVCTSLTKIMMPLNTKTEGNVECRNRRVKIDLSTQAPLYKCQHFVSYELSRLLLINFPRWCISVTIVTNILVLQKGIEIEISTNVVTVINLFILFARNPLCSEPNSHMTGFNNC